jgi:hypothetical protein
VSFEGPSNNVLVVYQMAHQLMGLPVAELASKAYSAQLEVCLFVVCLLFFNTFLYQTLRARVAAQTGGNKQIIRAGWMLKRKEKGRGKVSGWKKR